MQPSLCSERKADERGRNTVSVGKRLLEGKNCLKNSREGRGKKSAGKGAKLRCFLGGLGNTLCRAPNNVCQQQVCLAVSMGLSLWFFSFFFFFNSQTLSFLGPRVICDSRVCVRNSFVRTLTTCSGLCMPLVCGEKVHLARSSLIPGRGEGLTREGLGWVTGAGCARAASRTSRSRAGLFGAGCPPWGGLKAGTWQGWPPEMGTLPGDCRGAGSAPSPLHSRGSCWVCRSRAGSAGVPEPCVGPEKIVVGFGLSALALGALLAVFSLSAPLCSVLPRAGLVPRACLHLGVFSHRPIYFNHKIIKVGRHL